MSNLTPSWRKRLEEEQPDPSKWNKELTVLMDTSIEARPLHLPSSSKVRLKDSNYVIYRVRRKNGSNPDATRYMELKMSGYSNVTLADLENPQDLNAHVSADESEITEGIDLVWMKAKKEIHYGAMKFNMERSLNHTNPRRGTSQEALMRSTPLSVDERNSLAATQTRVLGGEEAGRMRGDPHWDEIVPESEGKKKGK